MPRRKQQKAPPVPRTRRPQGNQNNVQEEAPLMQAQANNFPPAQPEQFAPIQSNMGDNFQVQQGPQDQGAQ